MADIIQLRRGTAALWTSTNTLLAQGEQGYETDTGQRKTGNGVDAWNDLPYDGGGGGAGTVTSVAISGTDGIQVDSGSPITGSGTIQLGVNAGAMRTHLNVQDGATDDQTAAEILTAIKTVDGSTSGLDADFLDGLHASSFATSAQGTAADAAKAKTDFLTVTQPVDLDSIETRVNALDAAVVLKGIWDASSGTFPGGGSAQAGDSYIVSVAGTVGGVAFVANDRIIAILDNASTTTYASNWHKADYTDAVLSVASLTGAISAPDLRTAINVEDGADVTDATNVTAAGALMDSEVTSLSGIKSLTVPDSTTISAFGASLVDDADANAAQGTLGLTLLMGWHAKKISAFALIDNNWDASAGTFPIAPGSGSWLKGDSFRVSVAGTVSGINFEIGDLLVAQVDAASDTIYAANWIRVLGNNSAAVGGGDALVANTLDQFADVTQTSGATLAISASTTLGGGSHSGTNTGDQSLAGLVPLPTITTESTTTRTLALTDAHDWIHCTHASGCSVTVPPQSSVAWADGTIIYGDQGGAGAVTIVAGSGVTINCADTLVTDGQHSTFALIRISSNVWLLTGRLVT